jgi:4-diphosphocytidyl-2-C-methyl-D-erythritol kinase
MSLQEMLDLGQLVGSDVPFCLAGETAVARGRGEVLTKVNSLIDLHLVLVNSGFAVSTAQVFNLVDQETITCRPDSSKMAIAMEEGDLDKIVAALGNVMETVTFKLHPELQIIKDELVRLGAVGTLMSGSGPTIFGVFSKPEKARQAFHYIKGFYPYTFNCSSYLGNGGRHGEEIDTSQA